jgi:hypothetical protein
MPRKLAYWVVYLYLAPNSVVYRPHGLLSCCSIPTDHLHPWPTTPGGHLAAFCPHPDWAYRGWVGLGNLRANGHRSRAMATHSRCEPSQSTACTMYGSDWCSAMGCLRYSVRSRTVRLAKPWPLSFWSARLSGSRSP